MKRLIYGLIIAIILFAGVGVLYSRIQPSCTQPIKYSIGAVDPRFDISTSTLAADAKAAESVWEKASGRDLFTYDPASSFKINLIYDDRQARSDELTQVEGELQNSQNEYQNIDSEYSSLKSEYDSEHAAYAASSAALQNDLAAYNDEVDKWNAKGGAPQSEYEKLNSEKASLNQRSAALETKRQSLNDLAAQINDLADRGASVVNDYNSTVSTYNQEFGTSTQFDQGEFNGREIDIYQFKDRDDLTLVLAHEMGHALGLDHVSNPKSIMYYLMKDQNLNNIAPTAEDMAELDAVCRIPSAASAASTTAA